MKPVFFFCFILQASFAFSQIQTSVFKPDAVIKLKLRKESFQLPAGLNISNLTMLDSRTDTTSVGYSPAKAPKKYFFKNGFINEMEGWYSKYLMLPEKNVNGNTLLINIKKLRVSDEAAPRVLENEKPGRENNGWGNGVIVLIEYYLQKDSMFIPLYRFDSIIPLIGGIERYAESFISIGLRSSVVKLFTIKEDSALLSKKRFSFADIQKVNKKMASLPVFNSNEYQKGVYKTFNDFKMNTVSWNDFELRKGKFGDILYIKEKGTEYPLQDVWGYCDGKDLYINSAHKFSKLIRTGNTFYFQGIKHISTFIYQGFVGDGSASATTPGPGAGSSGSQIPISVNKMKYAINLRYYQLDMENGKTY